MERLQKVSSCTRQPASTPAKPLPTTSRVLELEKLGIAVKGLIRSSARGLSNTSTARLTIGRAISQVTSGLRRVLGWGLSRNT